MGSGSQPSAHRLDEYLVATRVAIAVDRVSLELDLTPGVGLAAEAMTSIDTDGDGQISHTEAAAHATALLNSIVLLTDGQPAQLTLVESQYPEVRDMTAGVGILRLRATAEMADSTPGRHVLTYVNGYRPDKSVYLANALVPSDRRVTIATQRRDPAQHELTLEYDVAHTAPTRGLSIAGGLGLAALLAAARRTRSRAISRTAC
jgi:hypothetical protein